MTSSFEHQKTSFKRNYLKCLISLASSDGNLDDDERGLICSIGIKRGLKEWQIVEVLNEPAEVVEWPETLSNKLNLVFDLAELMHVDGHLDSRELQYFKLAVSRLNLPDEIHSETLELFANGTPDPMDWKEFTDDISLRLQV